MLQILRLLEDDTTTDPDSMCLALGISRRTLFRDLAMLKSAGMNFNFVRGEQRYQRTSLEFKIGHSLSEVEIKAMHHWLGTICTTLAPDHSPLTSAIRKLLSIIKVETACLSRSRSPA